MPGSQEGHSEAIGEVGLSFRIPRKLNLRNNFFVQGIFFEGGGAIFKSSFSCFDETEKKEKEKSAGA